MFRKEPGMWFYRVAVLLLSVFLLLSGSALADRGMRWSLLNTVWTGDVTVVDVEGNTKPMTATLTFATETDFKFLSGTLLLSDSDTGTDDTTIPFSAVRYGNVLSIGAADYVIYATIQKHFGGHPKKNKETALKIQGNNVADGSIFIGTLTKDIAAE